MIQYLYIVPTKKPRWLYYSIHFIFNETFSHCTGRDEAADCAEGDILSVGLGDAHLHLEDNIIRGILVDLGKGSALVRYMRLLHLGERRTQHRRNASVTHLEAGVVVGVSYGIIGVDDFEPLMTGYLIVEPIECSGKHSGAQCGLREHRRRLVAITANASLAITLVRADSIDVWRDARKEH